MSTPVSTPLSTPQRLGIGLHKLMERPELVLSIAAPGTAEPLDHPVLALALAQAGVMPSPAEFRELLRAVQEICQQPRLAEHLALFQPDWQVFTERSWSDGQRLHQPDRVVIHAGRALVRCIDYKWQVSPEQQGPYAAQLLRYQQVLAQHYPGHTIEASLLTRAGQILPLQGLGLEGAC